MDIAMYQVDAFTTRVFSGNPAAVCLMERWLDGDVLQAIAAENNLSETAFVVPHTDGEPGHYEMRWFTPAAEVDLCGHATLASAHVLFAERGVAADKLVFATHSGDLIVTKDGENRYAMDFPALTAEQLPDAEFAEISAGLERVLGRAPVEIWRSVNLLAVYESEDHLRGLRYNTALGEVLMDADSWGLIVSAPSSSRTDWDFVSRFFAPLKGVPEDPVTGSAHCTLAPYWSRRFGKEALTGFQISVRGGEVRCTFDADRNGGRVRLGGACVSYLRGTITV